MHRENCGTCGAHLQGPFCHQCGEPATHEGDLGVRHLAHDAVHEFTHLDGKILRTLKALFFAPGKLTAEYWAGRRGLWVRPLRLYLVISALQLLLAANSSGPLGLRVWVSTNAQGGVEYHAGSSPVKGRSSTPVDSEMNHRIQATYLWVRYISLAIFAAAALGVYRKFQPWYGGHLIFGLHFYAFDNLVMGVAARAAPDLGGPFAITAAFLYLWLALKRVYRQGFWRTTGKSFVLMGAVSFAELLVMGISLWTAIRRH
jgi:hypothetical protein